MTALVNLLDKIQQSTPTQRDKGTSFENLMVQYFKNEPKYANKYREILSYADWVEKYGAKYGVTSKSDFGIDLVAITNDGENHPIQCKNYNSTTVSKKEVSEFLGVSGKTYFSNRYFVASTDKWTDGAKSALDSAYPPAMILTLADLDESIIDWSQYDFDVQKVVYHQPKAPRPHQLRAKKDVLAGMIESERGKLIMACGTGKTYTSLIITEEMIGKGGNILFLVPSLALLNQSLQEWSQDSTIGIRAFAVCSDSDVGKKDIDGVVVGISDLKFPATTNAKSLATAFKQDDLLCPDDHKNKLNVIFSTYHSINVISEAQKLGLPQFDLIVCDEAHRTTGYSFEDDKGENKESNFVKVHNNEFIAAAKRLYMTATPRIYGDDAKNTEGVVLCSMDDEKLYGKELHVITFSQAVSLGILCDYKVVVLAIDEKHVGKRIQKLLSDDNGLKIEDASKIIGCWKALAKIGMVEADGENYKPMQRAVAFCQVIEKTYKGKSHKVSSKLIEAMFADVVNSYQKYEIEELKKNDPNAKIHPSLEMKCNVRHVDGSMSATEKSEVLNWLKEELEEDECRIATNVRCLSEGVDVPALDAAIFLSERKSEVEIVQTVGRVMRRAKGKEIGYIILPVVVPFGMTAEQALDNNKAYRVVWQVLQALRSHDDRFDAMINKLELNGKDPSKMEVIAVTDKLTRKMQKALGATSDKDKARFKANQYNLSGDSHTPTQEDQLGLEFNAGEIERGLYATIVKKCGNRHHWEDWANDVAKIAQRHIDSIERIISNPENTRELAAFRTFAADIRDDVNNQVSDSEIVEMLAQHMITKPVFEALFADESFASKNPMSIAMQKVIDVLEEHHLSKEADTLQTFYESVKLRASDIKTMEGKQKIILELYDKFFRNAFPKMSERLGIVYTPIEVVDFIIHSVNDVLKSNFGKTLADKGVHILDPFTGTGAFITRLMTNGAIPANKLAYKYKNEIHANEIVLLAYYIATVNIESVYHSIIMDDYTPFEGICLTDTFALSEKKDDKTSPSDANSKRIKRQKELDIQVIIGNPPYSAGQTNANDNNANLKHPYLDSRITETYVKESVATNKNSLYDSYIKAIRWASDKIKDKGVLGFITNSGFLTSNTADGMRKCLKEEFSSIYIFNLKGAIRGKSGDKVKREGQNIFDIMTGVAITIMVKNPDAKEHGKIYVYEIEDYLKRTEKLSHIINLKSINGINEIDGWEEVNPDQFNDWFNQRDMSFNENISLGAKKNPTDMSLFINYSRGVATSRDAWAYNSSKSKLIENILRSIEFYNSEVGRYRLENAVPKIDDFINFDSTKFSWGRGNKLDLQKKRIYDFDKNRLRLSLYRPFTKSNLYFDKSLNDMTYQIPKLFPTAEAKNLAICLTLAGTKGFSVLISDMIPDLHLIGDSQCFPLYLYEKLEDGSEQSTDQPLEGYKRTEGISDEGLQHFKDAYPTEKITKEDIFYYVYGLLHNEEYRERYADNLAKELPRIPCVKKAEDFWAFSKAGRDLAELHLNYETVQPYNAVLTASNNRSMKQLEDEHYYVEKMKFAKKDDKSKVVYNSHITISEIPLEAYDYVVNGKPALEWVMERQAVTTHKDSGIVNDANDWAIETMGNAKYPLELLLRVVTVSLETQKIIRNLPKLDI